MRLSGAYGSDQLNLIVPAELLYWNGSAFTRNTADSCTAVQTANITLNPTTCTSVLNATLAFTSGTGNLKLQKSGAACRADVTVNLDAASENKQYLQGQWAGNSFIYNPTARATFGIYKNGSVIYMREIY
jgi:MSHA biogenesis protein MshQ